MVSPPLNLLADDVGLFSLVLSYGRKRGFFSLFSASGRSFFFWFLVPPPPSSRRRFFFFFFRNIRHDGASYFLFFDDLGVIFFAGRLFSRIIFCRVTFTFFFPRYLVESPISIPFNNRVVSLSDVRPVFFFSPSVVDARRFSHSL